MTRHSRPLSAGAIAWRWLAAVLMVYLLLVAVSMIGEGFELAAGGAQGARQLFAFADNPIMGLVIGAFATALVQSSSTVTSVIVGLVAGGLPVHTAIPMIMGANLGTTVTNTLVSLGHIGKRKEFRRAFAAATVHDFFNLIAILIFLPLEMWTGYLAKTAGYLSLQLHHSDAPDLHINPVHVITAPVIGSAKQLCSSLPEVISDLALILLGLLLIFLSIIVLGKVLKVLMVGRAKRILHKAIGRGPFTGISSGILMTIAVQSSSTTTSLVVPLAGNGLFKIKEIYPFTLGANIGTCVTALLAATAVTGPLSYFAMQIALVHMLFNLSAVILIYSVPQLRYIPPRMARSFARTASRHKWVIFVYVLGVFFILPSVLIALTS